MGGVFWEDTVALREDTVYHDEEAVLFWEVLHESVRESLPESVWEVHLEEEEGLVHESRGEEDRSGVGWMIIGLWMEGAHSVFTREG